MCCYSQHINERIIWQITDRCHLNCPYCFTPSRSLRDLALYEAITLVAGLRRMYPSRTRLLFAGREPLLYKGIHNVIASACDAGFTCSMSTSGELLNFRMASLLCKCGLEKINLTMNSYHNEIHEASRCGSNLKQVISAISVALELGYNLRVNITVSEFTLDSVAGTLKQLYALGVRDISIGIIHPFFPSRSSYMQHSTLIESAVHACQETDISLAQIAVIIPPHAIPCYEAADCPARLGLVAVLPDGTVGACNIFPDKWLRTEFQEHIHG
jgi:MoaA/NifB/PqqE/SkfB family radical SAM enzyme